MRLVGDFGIRMKELRLLSGMSQLILAERAGMDRSYIGGVERGERNVSLSNVEKICNALDVDVSYFFDEERFALHSAFLQEEFSKPLESRFTLRVFPAEQLITWRINGVLSAEDVAYLSNEMKSACLSLHHNGKVKLLADNRPMLANGQPFTFIAEVMELWEELQRWFVPYTDQAVVLCNCKLMKNQMDRLARRSGIYPYQQTMYDDQLAEALRLLHIEHLYPIFNE